MNTTICPPREKLKDYLTGWSDPELSRAIEAHLAECADCEQTIVTLEADPDTLVEYIRTAPESALPSEPDMKSVLSQARHLIDGSLDSPAQPSSEPLGINTTEIGPYELIRPLGHGGMGSVYLARHRKLGKQVAIKLLSARAFRGEQFAARFQREIRAAGELEHSAIVNATDAGQQAGTHYLVMEYIDGLDLSRIARAVGKLSVADACTIMRSIALGLSHAHSIGIVHRDIKPSNMMLSKTGQVKILDFGLAQHNLWDESTAELTTVGQLMGTLDYMAPEQAERADAVDYRADLYSIGATLFRLVCGHAPLAVTPNLSPLAKLRLLATYEPPSLDTFFPDAPPELVKLVNSLLARDPAQRPASAAHVAERLAAFTIGADLIDLIGQAQARVLTLAGDAVEQSPHAQVSIAPAAPAPNGIAPVSNMSVADASGGNLRWRWLVAAAILPLFLFAGVVITLEMQTGQLVIESAVDNVSVRLLKDGEFYQQLKIEPGANATRLYAGKYQVEIDSGSDSLQVDGQRFTLQQGQTVIARVRTVDAAIPAVMATVAQPEVNLAAESRNLDREILDSEIELKQMLERYGQGHPSVVAVERKLKLLKEFSSRSTQPANANGPTKPELLYEGKTLTHWLDVLAHERSPDTLSTALAAVNALLMPENHQRIAETLLGILPKLDGEMRMPSKSGSLTLDHVAFPVLARALQPTDYFTMLARQCAQTQDLAWRERMIEACRFAPKDANPAEFVDWLQLNIFKSENRHPLLDQATEVYSNLLVFQEFPMESSVEDRMLKTLNDCQFLGLEFWLKRDLRTLATSDYKLRLRGAKFFTQVILRALAAVDDPETSPLLFLQALKILEAVRGSLDDLLNDDGMAKLTAAIRKQLIDLAASREKLVTAVEIVDPSFDVVTLNGQGIKIVDYYTAGVISRNSSKRNAYITLEIMNFIQNMQLGTILDAELKSLHLATVPLSNELYLLIKDANPFNYRQSTSLISIDLANLPRDLGDSRKFFTFPSQQLWLAAIFQNQLVRMFPQIVTDDTRTTQSRALKRAWTESRFARIDSNADQKLNDSEFAEFAHGLFLKLEFKVADQNEDLFVTFEELFATLENASLQSPIFPERALPQEKYEWAKRQIAKYDLNGDDQLTADEWQKMILKPNGADTNNDGVITVEEYQNFRDNGRKGE